MATSSSPQTDALLQRLRPVTPAATTAASPFARGGQVKQLPGTGTTGKLADIGASVGTQLAAKQVGTSAAQGAASSGLKSALTSGASGAAAGAGVSLATGLLANKLRTKEEMPTFGGTNAAYLDDKGRRFQGTGGGIASNAVKYAGYGANPALIAATGGLSVAAGALGGAIKGAITKHAPSAYTDFKVEDGAQAIKDIYQKELGREASDEEVQGHLVGQGWDPTGGDRWVGEKGINNVLDAIRNSPEAQAFKANGGAGSAPAAAPAAGANPADPLGAGGGDPFSTGTQRMRDLLSMPAGGPSAPAAQLAQRASRAAGPQGVGTAALGAGPADPASGAGVPLDRQTKLRADLTAGAEPVATTDLESRATPGAGLGDLTGGNTGVTGGGPNSGQAVTATDTSGWDTDGYAPPAYVPQAAGPVPDGWDATKWNDPTHQTPKYGVGRILSQFPPTVEGLTNAFPEIEKAYPGATFNGKDKLTIPGVGTVDVLKGASNGGEAWRWGADDGAAAPAEGGAHAAGGGAGLIDASGGASNQTDVQALIAQLIGREGQQDSGGLTRALMNQLRTTA